MSGQKQILLLLPQGCELLEAAAFTDVFGWDEITGSGNIHLISAGATRPLTVCFGHTILPDLLWEEADAADFDAAALPGGFPRWGYFDDQQEKRLFPLLKSFHEKNKPIAAVCNGSLILARAGLLKEGHGVIYTGEEGRWQKQLADMGVTVEDAPVFRWRNIITARDPGSAVQAALMLLAELTDESNAHRIALNMGMRLR